MNIRSISGVQSPLQEVAKVERVKDVKLDSSHADRDADGRREQGESEKKRQFTDAEFQEALEHIQALPGFKSHALSLKVEERDSQRVVLILDPAGVVVRRLLEKDLWSLIADKEKGKGQFFDKAM